MLKGEFWSLPVAGVKCGACRETAASAFAFDADAGGIEPKLAGIRVQPNEDRTSVPKNPMSYIIKKRTGLAGGIKSRA